MKSSGTRKLPSRLWRRYCDVYADNGASAQDDLRFFGSKTLVNSPAVEKRFMSRNVPNTPGVDHPHHQIVCREPIFIPAFDEIRRVALEHSEKHIRDTYDEVQQLDNRLRRAQTWPDTGSQYCSAQEVECWQRERLRLLDRLVDLIPEFGTSPFSMRE
jgi:uncharacterized protein YdcH (DUF465 family)